MSPSPASPSDYRTVNAFLARAMGSESGGPLHSAGLRRTVDPESSRVRRIPVTAPDSEPKPPQQVSAKDHDIPTVQRGGRMAELRMLVVEMADELDRFTLGTFAVTGGQLREHYRDLVRTVGLDAALVDARERYRVQCLECRVLPLPAEGVGA